MSQAKSEIVSALVAVAGIGSFLLFLPISVLLITQMISACDNVTTLESFVTGMEERVFLSLFREFLIEVRMRPICKRFLGRNSGCCPLSLSFKENRSGKLSLS